MTIEQLTEHQRRQITQARAAAREDMVLEMAHIRFWAESPLQGIGPCWQWPHYTGQALQIADTYIVVRN
jgi:hypothetical protein